MVITITMRNVRLRNGIYEFRMAVPAGCLDSVGKKEITQSLKTSDPAQADMLAKKLTSEWKKKFKKFRGEKEEIPTIKATTQNTIADFKAKLDAHMEKHLGDYLINQSKDDLIECSEWLRDRMIDIRNEENTSFDLSAELGIAYPLPPQKSPGMTRRLNKTIIDALAFIRDEIDKEVGWKISEKGEEDNREAIPKTSRETGEQRTRSKDDKTNIVQVMNLMLDAKNIHGKNADYIRNEVKCFQEWHKGKADITQYSPDDLVDYVKNCLISIPKNMVKIDVYKGKSLRQCVDMVKSDSATYIPISHQTCKNRFAKLHMLFKYARDNLGLLHINPAMGITIPKVRVVSVTERGFSNTELRKMWKALENVASSMPKRPERFWIPIIGLYHGLRQNEICSLYVRDVYQDSDGIYVIDINDDGVNKSVKNKSSIRVIPVHPFVLDVLQFRKYIEGRNGKASPDDLLFPNLTYTKAQGYAKNMSVWFNKWKREWLDAEAYSKNFHSLRHTFIQQAQNQAQMPDRHNQEITGHAVLSVSSVHMAYSGRLKPKDVLVELSKVKYGWE